MKRNLVKSLALVLIFTMIIGIACTGCQKSNSTANESKSAAKTDVAQSDEKKEIVFWHSDTNEKIQGIIQDSADRFMKENPDVDVKIQAFQNDPYKTKLKVAMGSSNMPDIFQTWAGGPLYEYVQAGKVADITEMMNKENYKDRFLDAAMSMVDIDGKYWGVPEDNVSVAVVFYNKEIFKKYNIEVPKTYTELLKAAETLKSNEIIPFALANKTQWTGSLIYMYLADRMGGPDTFKKAANRAGGSFEDPAYIKTGEMLQDLVKKGYFNEGFNGLDYDTGQSRALLYSGKAAMEVMGTWYLATIKRENPEFFEKNMGYFLFPEVEGGKGDANNVIGSIGNMFYHVSESCKNKEEAFRFMQFLIDDIAVEKRAEIGLIPPVKGFKTDDPYLQGVLDIVGKAKSVQQWYDQYLPPELAEVHKETSQAIFGLTMTPEEAAKEMEKAAKEYYEE